MNCLYSLFSELQDILMALRSHPLRCMYTPTTRRSGGNPLFSFLSLFRLLLFFFLSLSLHGDLERETLFVTAATGPDSSVHPTARASSVCTPGQAGSGPPNCTPCPADSYAPFPGMSKCMPCPAQASTLGATGASSITQCACGAGYYLDTQLATCANCPAPQGDFFCPGGFTPANVAQRCS
ncbi:transmembrane, partial [Cystoisospora suis]